MKKPKRDPNTICARHFFFIKKKPFLSYGFPCHHSQSTINSQRQEQQVMPLGANPLVGCFSLLIFSLYIHNFRTHYSWIRYDTVFVLFLFPLLLLLSINTMILHSTIFQRQDKNSLSLSKSHSFFPLLPKESKTPLYLSLGFMRLFALKLFLLSCESKF